LGPKRKDREKYSGELNEGESQEREKKEVIVWSPLREGEELKRRATPALERDGEKQKTRISKRENTGGKVRTKEKQKE